MLAKHRQKYVGLAVRIGALVAVIAVVLVIQLVIIAPVLERDKAVLDTGASLTHLLKKNGPKNLSTRRSILEYVRVVKRGGVFTDLYENKHHLEAPSSIELGWAANVVDELIVKGGYAQLPEHFTQFTTVNRDLFEQKQTMARWFMLAASLLVVLLFVSIVTQLFKRLQRADRFLSASMRENKSILEATKEGLFLIKPSHQVSSVQSSAVQTIFGVSHPIQGDFFNFLKPLIAHDDFLTVKESIVSMLNGSGEKSLNGEFKPLQDVKISVETASGGVSEKYLKFDFSHNELKPSAGLLVSVSDVTQEVELKKELGETRRANEERFHLLMGSISSNSQDIKAFYREAHNGLKEISELLSDHKGEHTNNTQKFEEVLGTVQRLKGTAGSMGVPLIETSAHQFENKVAEVLASPHVDEKEILDLTLNLKDMISELNFLEQLNARINGNKAAGVPVLTAVPGLPKVSVAEHCDMHDIAKNIADQHGKMVALKFVGFENYKFDEAVQRELEAVCTQLIRNSIVHGIEEPDERRIQGKTKEGHITITLADDKADTVLLSVKDDGAGFDFYAIRKTIVQKGLGTVERVGAMSKSELVRFIFVSGFSTLMDKSDKTERGVGLDFVKGSIEQLGGKISVRSSRGISSQVSIRLPRSVFGQHQAEVPETNMRSLKTNAL